LIARRLELLRLRGKYLVMSFEDDVHLVMHLRMTGNILLTDKEPKHTRVRMKLDDGQTVLFVDQRRFGTGDVLLGSDALAEYFASRLGVEPLSPDFTAGALRAPASAAAPPRLHGGGAGRPGERAKAAGQGVPPEPGARGRRGEHLRRRGP